MRFQLWRIAWIKNAQRLMCTTLAAPTSDQCLDFFAQAQHPTELVRLQCRRFVDDGVELAGLETMQGFHDRIQHGVVQQDLRDMGFGDLWAPQELPDGPDEPNPET